MAIDACAFTFRILGPVQVIGPAGPLPFARPQHGDLLAYLLLNTNRVVGVDQIVDAMWRDRVPGTARAQVRNMLSALRGMLGRLGHTDPADATDTGRGAGTGHGGGTAGAPRPRAGIERQSAGYRLRVAGDDLDLAVFDTLVAAGRAEPDPGAAAALLRRAVDVWCGPHPLVGVRAPFADAVRAHLEEQLAAAYEALFEAELRGGNHAAVGAQLAHLADAHPGRERFTELLMLALYRDARPADALAVYRRTRERLVEEYGLEPGAALRDLHAYILRVDPALTVEPRIDPVLAGQPPRTGPVLAGESPRTGPVLAGEPPPATGPARVGTAGAVATGPAKAGTAGAAGPARAGIVGAVGTVVIAQLPLDVRRFSGRRAELAQLDALLAEATAGAAGVPVAVVQGTAGVGKTTLAIHWAHRVAGSFPDGQLYVNLRGFDPSRPATPPGTALRGFLHAFAVPPERVPDDLDGQAALYRSVLTGRRMLVVLDNAAGAEQVRPLLPGSPGCAVVITSRTALTGLVTGENAEALTLGVLSPRDAWYLLAGRLPAARMRAEPDAVDAILARCAYLPLALAVVAARAGAHPAVPLAELAAELGEPGRRLAALSGHDPAVDPSTVFSWSYRQLSEPAAALFRLLGEHPPADLAAPAAASLAGVALPEAHRLLSELTRAHLIGEPVPRRYALHDLLRAYATQVCRATDPRAARRAAVRRLLDHYLHSAHHAGLRCNPNREPLALGPVPPGVTVADPAGPAAAAWDWLATEHRALVAAVDLAADKGLATHAWQLAYAIAYFLDQGGHWHDWATTQARAVAAAETADDPVGAANAHRNLGVAYTRFGRHDDANLHLTRALSLFSGTGDPVATAHVHARLGSMFNGQGRWAEALEHGEQALARYRQAGHLRGEARALNNVGWYLARLSRYREALACGEQSLALYRGTGPDGGAAGIDSAHALSTLGYVHRALGDHRAAVDSYESALTVFRAGGHRLLEAVVLGHLGHTYAAAGDNDAAVRYWRAAVAIIDDLGHSDADTDDIRRRLHDVQRTTSAGQSIRPT